jgi:hypothetical protein
LELTVSRTPYGSAAFTPNWEGLQTSGEDDDLLSAMARELVEKNGIGESADAIWKELHQGHQKLVPSDQRSVAEDQETEDSPPALESEPARLIEAAISGGLVLVFGQLPDLPKSGRRRSRSVVPEQQSLFGRS